MRMVVKHAWRVGIWDVDSVINEICLALCRIARIQLIENIISASIRSILFLFKDSRGGMKAMSVHVCDKRAFEDGIGAVIFKSRCWVGQVVGEFDGHSSTSRDANGGGKDVEFCGRVIPARKNNTD